MTHEQLTTAPELVRVSSDELRRAILVNQRLNHEIDAQINYQKFRHLLTPQGERLVKDYLAQAQREAQHVARRQSSWLDSLDDGHTVKFEPVKSEESKLLFAVTTGDMNPALDGDKIEIDEAVLFLRSFRFPRGSSTTLDEWDRELVDDLAGRLKHFDDAIQHVTTIVLQPPTPFI